MLDQDFNVKGGLSFKSSLLAEWTEKALACIDGKILSSLLFVFTYACKESFPY